MKTIIWCMSFLLLLSACGTGVNAPLKTNKGDETLANSDWLFDVETEQTDEELVVKMTVTNNRNQEASLDFSSGQKYELLLLKEDGTIVYRYSEGMMFTMALVHETFKPFESKVYEERVSLDTIPAGSYTLDAELVLAAVDGGDWDKDLFHQQVEVTIQ